jgi:hypothetical protein
VILLDSLALVLNPKFVATATRLGAYFGFKDSGAVPLDFLIKFKLHR